MARTNSTPAKYEIEEFEKEVHECIKDLDFAVRMYYQCLKDDKDLTELDIRKIVRATLSKGYKMVDTGERFKQEVKEDGENDKKPKKNKSKKKRRKSKASH